MLVCRRQGDKTGVVTLPWIIQGLDAVGNNSGECLCHLILDRAGNNQGETGMSRCVPFLPHHGGLP